MDNNIKVSIIMPSLNVVEYIDECMRSALGQTLSSIEILCIDAGSTDGTAEKLKKYEQEDSRVQYINSPIRSYGYQVNTGIEKAKGTYIAVLETDDFVEGNMYERLYDIAVQYQCDYVKADYFRFFENESKCYDETPIRMSSNIPEIYNKIIDASINPGIFKYDHNIWRGIYSRQFLINKNIKLNTSKGAAFQDIGFLMQVYCCAERAYYIEDLFYHYRMDREDSSINSNRGVQYVFQEANYLLEHIGLEDITRDKFDNVIRERLVDAFNYEFDKCLRIANYDINDESILPFLDFINDKLLPEQCDFNEYALKLYRRDERLKDYNNKLDNLASSIKRKMCIIFSAGAIGKNAYNQLTSRGISIIGFVDNDRVKVGKPVCDKQVFDVDCILDILQENTVIVIANKNHSQEIKKQLTDMGIGISSIYEYPC